MQIQPERHAQRALFIFSHGLFTGELNSKRIYVETAYDRTIQQLN